MNKIYIRSLLIITLLVVATPSQAWFGKPKNYDECILENMKGVTSDSAARAIRASCRKMFEQKIDVDIEVLPHNALKKLDGKGYFYESRFITNIYNGNEDWKITSLKIRITDNTKKESRTYNATYQPEHVFLSIPYLSPLSEGTFSFDMYNVPEDRSWSIVGGYGYK